MTGPNDVQAREEIERSLGETLFVEAGAGTGKTTSLVGRIIRLIATGRAEIRRIAAITFTEAAASELRERIRTELERSLRNEPVPEVERARFTAALADIDDAPLQTLHAFANRVLARHAVAAGLPPGFELRDAPAQQQAFTDRWQGLQRDLLLDPRLAADVRLALRLGLRIDSLQVVARAFHESWDLLALTGVAEAPTPVPPEAPDVSAVLEALDRAYARRDAAHGPEDPMRVHLLARVGPLRSALEALAAAGDTERLVALLPEVRSSNAGNKKGWQAGALEEIKASLKAAAEEQRSLLEPWRRHLVAVLVREVAVFTLEGAAERQRSGVLEFHDLLVRARELLADPGVRQSVRTDYEAVLIDEFQDTDPLQIELAARIGSVHEGTDWRDLHPEPGRLFFVGDPKQSIYRFRRADIGVYSEVQALFGGPPGRTVSLTQNWRSQPAILELVNRAFAPWFRSQGASDRTAGVVGGTETAGLGNQAPWEDLVAGRPATDPADRACTVALLGGPISGANADAVRVQAASEVVAAVELAVGQRWQVVEGKGDAARLRPIRLDDIAVLLPTRTALPALERALEDAGIPYRVEARSLVWATQQVRDVLAVLRAVEDPSDEVACVAALLSAAYGCGHDELQSWLDAGGAWSRTAEPPPGVPVDHPVRAALRDLQRLADLRQELLPSELVDAVVTSRRLAESAFARRRQREAWARLRFVAEQARAFVDGGGTSLRAFVDWADRQADEAAQGLESVVPEPDDHAVRILTIHAAKGLEFPAVIVAGLNTLRRAPNEGALVYWGPDHRPEVQCGRADLGFCSAGFARLHNDEAAAIAEEQARLLYVACTRARDHLVVSLHHAVNRDGNVAGQQASNASDLHRWSKDLVLDGLVRGIDALRERYEVRPVPAPAPVTAPEPAVVAADLAAQREVRRSVLERASRSTVVSAIGVARVAADRRAELPLFVAADLPEPADPDGRAADLEDGPGPDPVDDGAVLRPRPAGTAFGIAVHAVLEHAPLGVASDLAGVARAAAVAAGLEDADGPAVEHAALAALGSPAAVEAAAGRSWREVFVAAVPFEGAPVVEGFVDLLYEVPGGLVVADWKSDRVGGIADAEAKAEHYRVQLAAYALALEASLGRPVVRCSLVFCGTGADAVQVDIAGADLRRACEAARSALRS